MAKNILSQLLGLINSGSTLESAIEAIVPGADPTYWQRQIARQESKRKPRKITPHRASSKPRAKFNYAAQVLSGAELQTNHRAAATAELVERVNSLDDPVEPDPVGGYLVIVNDEPTIWADTPTDARRSYEDYYIPRPIVWRVAGQTIDLEVEL